LSSILRALKKLEEDSMPPDEQSGEGSKKIKMRRVVTRRAKAPRVINRFLSILLALLLLGTAGLIIMKSNKKPAVTKKQDTSPQKPALTHLPQPSPTLKKESPKESKPPVTPVEQVKPSIIPAIPEIVQLPQPGKVETKDQKESAKKKKHPQLILNGILWSDNPARRVALINDRYLKEGDEIKGVSVIRIEKKTVTLQSGQETWTIRLKE